MKTEFKKFLLLNSLATLILGIIGTVVFLFALPEFFHPIMPIILILAAFINIVNFKLILGNQNMPFNLMMAITKSFALKFFSYISMIVVIILLEREKSLLLALVIFVFLLYIVYTALEVKAFVDYARNKK